MASDDRAYAAHTAVTTLDVAPVEQLVIPVTFGEMFVHQFKETARYVSSDTLVVGRVEPGHIASTLPLTSGILLVVRHIIMITAFLQSFLVCWCSFRELLLIA